MRTGRERNGYQQTYLAPARDARKIPGIWQRKPVCNLRYIVHNRVGMGRGKALKEGLALALSALSAFLIISFTRVAPDTPGLHWPRSTTLSPLLLSGGADRRRAPFRIRSKSVPRGLSFADGRGLELLKPRLPSPSNRAARPT